MAKAEGVCALCRASATLCDSHVVPEFFYKALYDEKKRFFQYSTDASDPAVPRQKGIWERLFCQTCETGLLGSLDDYGKRVLFAETGDAPEWEPTGIRLTGVDYQKFKLFQMSMLWRAGVSSRPEFASVQLNRHSEELRRRLFASDPGSAWEYGCLMIYPPEEKAQIIFSHVLGAPDLVRVQGHHAHRFLLGGMFWLFFVSSHMQELADGPISLQEDGTLRFFDGGQPTMVHLTRLAKQFTKAEQLRRAAQQTGQS